MRLSTIGIYTEGDDRPSGRVDSDVAYLDLAPGGPWLATKDRAYLVQLAAEAERLADELG